MAAEGAMAVVLGTRPEIIKLGIPVRLLGDRAWVVDTGQHYDTNLNGVFYDVFGLERPDTVLGIGGMSRGAQIGQAVRLLDQLFAERRPAAVVVHGDTNSALAGALAANACDLPLIHVEAGLRSFDRAMPEEHNRVVIDHLADLCLAPTDLNAANLVAEGVPMDRIVVTGNTVVDAVLELTRPPAERDPVLERYGVRRGQYVLTTFHRPENVDEPDVLATIIAELASLPLPVVLPIHPRTRRIIESAGLEPTLQGLIVVDPIDYLDFLSLAADCAFLVSDSGGVQEESTVVKRPVIVVRKSTERPEVLGSFAELIPPGSGISEVGRRWLSSLPSVHRRLEHLPSPYGIGDSSKRTVDAIVDFERSA
jgi:UDP-N-acetylglucosamine 2-epimerase (non-hydrolysing)